MQQTDIFCQHSLSSGALDDAETRVPVATGGPTLTFDLLHEVEQMRRERVWSHGRNAKTLVKHSDFRLVLTVMNAGTQMHQHQTKGTVCIQLVSGHVRIRAVGKVFDLFAAQMLSLDANVLHDVEVIEDSVFLVSVAWPSDSLVVQPQGSLCDRKEFDWEHDESVWN